LAFSVPHGAGRQVAPDRLALKPYWGKPAVRNFREGDGDVGIIRSPVRAISPPDTNVDNLPEFIGSVGMDTGAYLQLWTTFENELRDLPRKMKCTPRYRPTRSANRRSRNTTNGIAPRRRGSPAAFGGIARG